MGADAGVVGAVEAEMMRHLTQIGILGRAYPAVGKGYVKQPVEQMLEHDRLGGEQPPDLAGVALKPVNAPAGEIEDQIDVFFLAGRDLKDLVKSGDLVAGDVAVGARHLGAERDRGDRERDAPARVAVGRIVRVVVHDVIRGAFEQCTERAAKWQLARAGDYSADKAHRFPVASPRTGVPAHLARFTRPTGFMLLLRWHCEKDVSRRLGPLAAEGSRVERCDAIVVGGGLVGSAIAYGLARAGLATVLLDEGDVAFRASRGNFGLVWVQSKGDGAPHYQRWTRRSADQWPALAAELLDKTGIAVGHRRPGGVHLCLGEAELEDRRRRMERMRRQSGNFGFEYRMLDHREVAEMLPGIGPAVSGASWTPYDGHANPLDLLHALHKGFVEKGGRYIANTTVTSAGAAPGDFRIAARGDDIAAPCVVLAAGLGNAALAPVFGLDAPVRPQRGQILVTERVRRLLPMPTTTIRQTEKGSIMLGDSQEDVGFDTSQKPAVMQAIASRAVLSFPWLRELQIVRAWAALRVMPPDGLPIYDQSERFPGAFTANCHSGVTLAAAHADILAPMIAGGALDPALDLFSAKRFGVPAAA